MSRVGSKCDACDACDAAALSSRESAAWSQRRRTHPMALARCTLIAGIPCRRHPPGPKAEVFEAQGLGESGMTSQLSWNHYHRWSKLRDANLHASLQDPQTTTGGGRKQRALSSARDARLNNARHITTHPNAQAPMAPACSASTVSWRKAPLQRRTPS